MLPSFVKNHWRKMAAGTITAAVGVWLWEQMTETSYGLQALQAARDAGLPTPPSPPSPASSAPASSAGRGEGKEGDEVLKRMQAHFQATQDAADDTVLRWVGMVREAIVGMVPIDATKAKLRGGADNEVLSSEEKAAIWGELVEMAFIQALLSVYAISALKILFRTQMNILGRNVYLDIVQSGSTARSSASDPLQAKFLARCFFFLKTGLPRLALKIEHAVHAALEQVSLASMYSLSSLLDLVASVRAAVEGPNVPGASSNLAQYLVPPSSSSSAPPSSAPPSSSSAASSVAGGSTAAAPADPDSDPEHPLFKAKLDLLVSELDEYIKSSDSAPIIGECLDAAFAEYGLVLESKVRAITAPSTDGKSTSTSTTTTDDDDDDSLSHRLQLARFVGPLVGSAKSMLSSSTSGGASKLNTALSSVPRLESLCALIYSDFDRRALFEVIAPPPSPSPLR